jgi:hypothetical protein
MAMPIVDVKQSQKSRTVEAAMIFSYIHQVAGIYASANSIEIGHYIVQFLISNTCYTWNIWRKS